VVADIDVKAPYPRRGDDFRNSIDYNAYCSEASQALHSAMAAGDHL
jgi:hypothetical protein